MKGYGNHHRLAKSTFLGRATTTSPFGLYDCGAFPGMAKDGKAGQPILGEAYQIDERTLASCDMLEGHPNFYRREETEVMIEGAKAPVVAYAYFIQPPAYFHWQRIGNQWPKEKAKKGS
jgi:gamma-glutamylcyclotransferase (GGCT)/AIG2-like uncharacterized protein YtfP